MGPTPLRNFRIADDIWFAAVERANQDGDNLSEIMRGWLSDYAAGRRRVGPGRPDLVELSRAELTKLRAMIDKLLS